MGGMRGGMNMRGRGGLNQGMMTNWGGMGVMPNMMSMPNIGAGMNMQGQDFPFEVSSQAYIYRLSKCRLLPSARSSR